MAEKGLLRLQVSSSGFVFDPQTGGTFSLNFTGLRILTLLRQGKSTADISVVLAREYDVRLADAIRDVEDFLNNLRECGLFS